MANPAIAEEMVSFHRRSELPGVEIHTVQNSARAFRCYSPDFELFAPISWQGEIWHRRRQATLEPGSVLCAHPGEVFLARRVITPGAGSFLTIDARVFHEYLAAHPRRASTLQLRPFTRMSKLLQQRLLNVFQVVRPGPSAMEIQTAMVEFMAVLAKELLEDAYNAGTSIDAALQTAERVGECLHEDAPPSVGLTTLAGRAGVSRFQALRQFKRRYGLPPHTYQLSVRLALAQKALREGRLPAQVAAQFGFVDQSHLTRHFKRVLGVTPAQYARVGGRPERLGSELAFETRNSDERAIPARRVLQILR